LKKGRLSFYQKALLVDACGFARPSALAALLEVNEVRNRLAHKDVPITAAALEGISSKIDWPKQIGRPPISDHILSVAMAIVLPEVYRPFALSAMFAEYVKSHKEPTSPSAPDEKP
jgi:hypothetical protein